MRHGGRSLVILSLLVAAAGAGCSAVRGVEQKLEARRQRPKTPYRVISPAIAYEIVRDTPGLMILDLRQPEEFHGGTGHLGGAINIPLGRLPYRLLEIRSYRGETFLVYCDTTACGDAGMRMLHASGFDDAMLIDGGIQTWIQGGYATYARPGTPAQFKSQTLQQLVPERLRHKGSDLPVAPPKPRAPDEPPPAMPPPPPAPPQ